LLLSSSSFQKYSLRGALKRDDTLHVDFCGNPIGNYKYALQNGMKIIESYNRQKEAEFGIKILANELENDII